VAWIKDWSLSWRAHKTYVWLPSPLNVLELQVYVLKIKQSACRFCLFLEFLLGIRILNTVCMYEGISESCQTDIAVTASISDKWDRRPKWHFRKPIASVCHMTPHCGGQSDTSASLSHQSATWHYTVNAPCFYTSAFRLCVSIPLWWMTKSRNVSTSSFVWSSVCLLWKPLKCFASILENIHNSRQRFLNGIHVSRPVECRLKMRNIQGDQAPAKWQKM
jgi:hypothetical protein